MKFFDRLLYFGFGTGLGCLLVYFMLLKDRDLPAWLPSDRVLEELTQGPIDIANGVVVPLNDSLLVSAIMNSDVIFSESIVRDALCRTYQLDSKMERMRFEICDEDVRLIEYLQKEPHIN